MRAALKAREVRVPGLAGSTVAEAPEAKRSLERQVTGLRSGKNPRFAKSYTGLLSSTFWVPAYGLRTKKL